MELRLGHPLEGSQGLADALAVLLDALADVEEALTFRTTHLSCYQLTLEPNTLFHRQPPELPDEDEAEAMQTAIEARLGQDDPEDSLPQACRELLLVLAAHNGKEEPIFYATADEALDASENAELTELIASGRMPTGWVCRQANPGPGRATGP